jgi:hypothetical protein
MTLPLPQKKGDKEACMSTLQLQNGTPRLPHKKPRMKGWMTCCTCLLIMRW